MDLMSDLSKRRRARRWKPKPTAIIIAFCCNDPDTGNFTGGCTSISFPSESLELTSWGCSRRLRTESDSIILSGKRWPVVDHRYGVGNWCWDGYWLKPRTATEFLLWLRERRLFETDGGWPELADWYEGEGPRVSLELLEQQLCRAQREHRF